MSRPWLAILSMAVASTAAAQDHAHAPATQEQLGAVRFPTSCATAVAPNFNRAVALLHSFEFGASIRAFTQIAALDSSCAMAHWGIAMSRWSNPMAAGLRTKEQLESGNAAAREAFRLAPRASTRERAWIAAVSKLSAA